MRRRRIGFIEYDQVRRMTSDLGALEALAKSGPESAEDVKEMVNWLVDNRDLALTPFTRHSRSRNSVYYSAGEYPKMWTALTGTTHGPTISWLKDPERLNWEMVVHEMAHHEMFLSFGLRGLNSQAHNRRFVAVLDDMTAQVLVDYPNLTPAPPQQVEEPVTAQAASKPTDQGRLF